EYKAEKAMESLREMTSPTATVIRSGIQERVPSGDLVPGDVILLESGEVVPADGRLIEVLSLEIDESILTGESIPVAKITDVVVESTQGPIGDRINMVYSGTTVVRGRGKAVVTATGMSAEIGKIAKVVSSSSQSESTPLTKRLNRLAFYMFILSLGL